jgi:hypothetical protein
VERDATGKRLFSNGAPPGTWVNKLALEAGWVTDQPTLFPSRRWRAGDALPTSPATDDAALTRDPEIR